MSNGPLIVRRGLKHRDPLSGASDLLQAHRVERLFEVVLKQNPDPRLGFSEVPELTGVRGSCNIYRGTVDLAPLAGRAPRAALTAIPPELFASLGSLPAGEHKLPAEERGDLVLRLEGKEVKRVRGKGAAGKGDKKRKREGKDTPEGSQGPSASAAPSASGRPTHSVAPSQAHPEASAWRRP